MKIAQVAPLYESVPPRLYGGTERIVSFLTGELVELGHDVTLFASGDSVTDAHLVSVVPESLRLRTDCEDSLAPHIVQLKKVMERGKEFDFIHFHTDYLGFIFSSSLDTPHATTLHGKLTIPELQMIYNEYPDEPVISISDSQAKPLPQANFVGTVHHGLPSDLFELKKEKENYFAFVGRISPEKGCDRAIQIAIKTNTPLRIAAKVDKNDRDYFESDIKPLLEHPLIEFKGEINEDQKQEFIGNAKGFLFPINWPEPFGIVMIEAMACGTPVIAWDNGSVPEIIENGKSGFIVNTMGEAIAAANKLSTLDPVIVRNCFDERFTARRMAMDYMGIYEKLIAAHDAGSGWKHPPAKEKLSNGYGEPGKLKSRI
jgi:glycosyltransferase involved in cell wall biosynthesis